MLYTCKAHEFQGRQRQKRKAVFCTGDVALPSVQSCGLIPGTAERSVNARPGQDSSKVKAYLDGTVSGDHLVDPVSK